MLTSATGDKQTQMRVERALGKPGATGKKGFLLWAQAALPKPVVERILAAAKKELPAGAGAPQLGMLGLNLATFSLSDLSDNPADAPVSGVTAATSSGSAEPSWLSSIGAAISAASQVYLNKAQIDAMKDITQINLKRAAAGQPPIAIDPTRYGLQSPTANIGLTSGTRTALLVGAGVLGIALVLSGALKGRKH